MLTGDNYMVEEYYCEGGVAKSEDVNCPSAEICIEGRCVPSTCEDSDGNNIYVKGAVVKNGESFTDYCSGGSVEEYTCSGLTLRKTVLGCDAGFRCEDGACIGGDYSTVCVDSDGRRNPEVRGTVSRGGMEWVDYCVNQTVLHEYFCEANYERGVWFECNAGYVCREGACVPAE